MNQRWKEHIYDRIKYILTEYDIKICWVQPRTWGGNYVHTYVSILKNIYTRIKTGLKLSKRKHKY